MGNSQKYTMPDELGKILKPIPGEMVRLITLKLLQVRGFWLRPVIEQGQTGACPCCGDVQQAAAFGICAGCYEPAISGAMLGSALLDHLARRSDIDEEGESQMGKETQASEGVQQYALRPELAAVLKQIPKAMIETVTLKDLISYWVRPLMRATKKGECPCCGGVYLGKACGVCSGCYDPANKKGLSGPELLEHLFARVKFGKKWRPETQKNIDNSSATATESSPSAAATSNKDELVKSFGERMGRLESAAFEVVFRTALGIEKNTPARELPLHLEELMRERDNLRIEHEELAEILGAGEDGNLRLFAQRRMAEAADGANAISKVEALTEEIVVLTRLPATKNTDINGAGMAKLSELSVPDGYESLASVLHDAIDQAANGKWLERHAADRSFHDHPIMRETQAVGLAYPAGQARKNILEAVRCYEENPELAVADLLEAINLTAAVIIAVRASMFERACVAAQ